jgi:signal transduction histidine kinase
MANLSLHNPGAAALSKRRARRIAAGAFLVFIVILATASTGAVAQEASSTPERPTVVYGGNQASPPFEYLDAGGRPQGFNVELFRALAREGGRTAEVRLGVWSSIVAAVARREVDVVTLGYAEARTADFDFLAETWTLRQAAFFPPGRSVYPQGVEQMRDEIVAVQERSIVHELLRALPDSQRPSLRAAPNHLDAVKALTRGEATAVAGNSLVLRTALNDEGLSEAVEVPIKAASYQLATGRGRAPEAAWIAPALQRLKESGEYSRLVEKHLAAQRGASPWPIAVGALAAALLVGGLGYAGATLWNASLRRQVAARTSQLLDTVKEKDRLATSLVEREAERERLIADLEAKNAELERFSYTVSHDLKSPLVTIGTYAGLIEKDARAGDMSRFIDDVARIQRAASRMRRLLDELLNLSRIGRVVNPLEEVALGELAREAADLVRGRLDEARIQIHIAPDLPTVQGDRVRLLEVMLNLIDNAAKFASSERTPRIDIGVDPERPSPSFFVRDNGIGIDPQHQEKIFGLFDKLDLGSDGTGIGLALVRRIVEAHGGRISVESGGAGAGATFHVTLT